MNFYYFKIYAVFLPPTRRLIVEEGSGKKRMEETTTIFLPVLRERARFFNLRLPTTNLLDPSHDGRVPAFLFRSSYSRINRTFHHRLTLCNGHELNVKSC